MNYQPVAEVQQVQYSSEQRAQRIVERLKAEKHTLSLLKDQLKSIYESDQDLENAKAKVKEERKRVKERSAIIKSTIEVLQYDRKIKEQNEAVKEIEKDLDEVLTTYVSEFGQMTLPMIDGSEVKIVRKYKIKL